MTTRARRLLLLVLPALCLSQSVAMRHDPAGERRQLWDREVARLSTIVAALPSDLEKTTFLREYAGQLIDIGRPDEAARERYRSVNFESFDAAEFYPLFKSHSLPAECGITSFFYIKLLQAFGFKAYQYSFGFTMPPYQRFIHSVALVEIRVRGSRRLIVQDAYLNLTYRDDQGEPADFFDLLSALKRREYRRIVADPRSVETLLLVPDPAIYYRYLSGPCRALMTKALTRPDGSVRTQLAIARDYATLMQSPCDEFEKGFSEALRESGFSEPFIYAYTLRASDVVGAPDHAEVQRRIDLILH